MDRSNYYDAGFEIQQGTTADTKTGLLHDYCIESLW